MQRTTTRPILALGLALVALPAHALSLPTKADLLKTVKADVGQASESVMPPWSGLKWDYLSAPLAKFDMSGLANPVTSVAAAVANTVIDDGVRLRGQVVSWQVLGDHGWELIAIHNGMAYFKRPKADPAASGSAELP